MGLGFLSGVTEGSEADYGSGLTALGGLENGFPPHGIPECSSARSIRAVQWKYSVSHGCNFYLCW